MMDVKHIMECPSCDAEHTTYGEDFNIDELLECFYSCDNCRSEICEVCLKHCDECNDKTYCEECLEEHEKEHNEEVGDE